MAFAILGGNPGREVAVNCEAVNRPGMMLSAATSRPIGCGVLLHCINAAETQEWTLAMKVKDVMHKCRLGVSPNTPITEFAKLMRAHDIGCIPIGEDDKLIGMVTDRDIVCKRAREPQFRCRPRDGARCDDRRHPLLPRGRRPRKGDASHGEAEAPQAEQEQADGRHDQSG
jgi:hypothetical protein